jgi:hypothetical protein
LYAVFFFFCFAPVHITLQFHKKKIILKSIRQIPDTGTILTILLIKLYNFLVANEIAERTLSASVTANLIIYLTTKYHLGAASSAIIIFVYQAAANFFPVCGAIVSDALLGRYLMVTITLFFCTIVRASNKPLAQAQRNITITFTHY